MSGVIKVDMCKKALRYSHKTNAEQDRGDEMALSFSMTAAQK